MKWHCEKRGTLPDHNYPNRKAIDTFLIDHPDGYMFNTPEQNAKNKELSIKGKSE